MEHGFGYFEEDQLGQVHDVGLWQRILAYMAPYWRGVAVAVVLSLLITGTSLALPYLVSIGVDRFIVNEGKEISFRLSGLSGLVVPFLCLIVIEFVANFFQVTILEWTGQNMMHRMRQHLFSRLLELELSFFNRHPVGKLVTRLTNDIQNMHEMFTSVIVTLFNDLVRIVAILAVLFWMNWRLALIMSLLLPLMILNTVCFSRLAREAFRQIRTHLARLNSYLQETLSGMVIVQLFQREQDTGRRFRELNQQYYLKTIYQIRIFGLFMPLIEVMSSLAVGLIIWYGGGEIIQGQMTIGVLVAFLSYMRLFFQPLRELSQKYSIVQSAMASAERIFQLLDSRSRLPVPERPQDLPEPAGGISFQDVSFGYDPARPVLKNFSLEVKAGEILAIVGATGSGKTTVINLLERFYDPDLGRIEIDGVELRHLDPQRLRMMIGLVMQEVYVIPGTVRENILLDREMSDADLGRVIDRAQLAGLVAQLPQGVETMIGEGGMELSAGQRQLLAFARVMAREPLILVLDEATSNVDTETEILVEKVIETVLAKRTSIVVAHRLSTIRRADRILVMDHGRIVEEGSHESLLARQGLYHHLHNLQNNGNHHIIR